MFNGCCTRHHDRVTPNIPQAPMSTVNKGEEETVGGNEGGESDNGSRERCDQKMGGKSMTSLVCSFAYFYISGFSNFMDEMAFIWVDKNRGGRENSGSCEAELTICFGNSKFEVSIEHSNPIPRSLELWAEAGNVTSA